MLLSTACVHVRPLFVGGLHYKVYSETGWQLSVGCSGVCVCVCCGWVVQCVRHHVSACMHVCVCVRVCGEVRGHRVRAQRNGARIKSCPIKSHRRPQPF